ncbi:glycosyltransferase family 4 protein [Rothia sp. CCM 9419]|uniref:glycosyltransferase family 4 protein n=1 Tax=Rothia sp. CCM 9419 TaxID=3402662 RepID=UPI003AEEC2F9
MRLIIDARYTRYGFHDGISRYTASLLEALKKLHDEQHPLCADLEIIMAISDIRQLKMLPDMDYILVSSPTNIREPFIARTLNKYHPDVVFSPMQTIGSWGKKFHLILTLHDLIYYEHPTPPSFLPRPIQWGWRLFHRSYTPQRLLLNRADAVATVSQTSAQLIRQHHLTKKPLHIIPNAAATGSIVSEEQAQDRIAHRQKTLLYMGSFMEYKNVETLMIAMKDLPEYRLLLLSRISEQRQQELHQYVTDNIEFCHGVGDEEYQQLLATSTALLTASRAEGYGLPVVEAQAQGCPVVISDIDIFHEIAPHGLHCNPEDPQAFVQAIRTLENTAHYQQVVREGLRDAQRFSWKESALQLLNVATNMTRANT